jgi:2-polyprenyl-3-methyl-5-hydroxy-6-metoxy-1,4-benzoquinol methylase
LPFFSKVVGHFSPFLLRAVRNSLLDLPRIRKVLPPTGKVLEIGCGYGHVLSQLAEERADLQFLGIDKDAEAIDFAQEKWKLPNLKFHQVSLEEIKEHFDLVLVLDVIHHLPEGVETHIFKESHRLLEEDGLLFVKDIPLKNCRIGVFVDKYVSRQPPLVRTDDQLQSALKSYFKLISWETPTRLKMGELYFLAEKL